MKELGFTKDQTNILSEMKDWRLESLKNEIDKLKKVKENYSKSDENYRNKKEKGQGKILELIVNRYEDSIEYEPETIVLENGRKPRILFISDVKGWAWWIKSEYIKKYLSDEFQIDIDYVIGDNGDRRFYLIDQNSYDLYFIYGFSYIDFLNKVPKKKKICGITAHRKRNVILPKMKMAGNHHANSIMLLKELQDMGFKRAYYVPNGVDEELFKPIKPIRKEGELIVGHVGKECPAKGQREFILPAIQATGCKSATNLRTYMDKLPHSEMPKIYNEMDVFMVASTEDGTPNPALEAAACGRPIISNKIGNMPEFIKDGYNGFIVPRKIGAYIEKILYFKNNRDELIRMGNNARKTIEENWTWKIQAENYRKMFRDIFKRS